MFKEFRNLTKHSIIYSIGNIASRLVGIVLIPLYTKRIAMDQFGIYALLEVTIQFAQAILMMGLVNALFRWLSLKNTPDERREIFSSIFYFLTILSVLLVIVVYFSQSVLSHLFFSTTQYDSLLVVTAIIIGILLPQQIIFAQLRYENRSLFFITVKLLKFTSQLLITIYLIVAKNMEIAGILYGHLISDALVFLLLFPYTLKKLSLKWNFREMIPMIKFGAPLSISALSSRFLNMGDRYILGILTDLRTVAIYSIGYKIANLIDTLFIQSFQYAFIPIAWQKVGAKNAKRFYSKTITYLSFFLFWIALFVSSYRTEIMHIFTRNPEYWQARDIICVVAIALCFKGISMILKMGLQFSKQTQYIAAIVFGAAVLNILLNLWLIPIWSIMGAALATLIAFLLQSCAALILSHRYYPLKYEWLRIGKILIAGLGLYIITDIFHLPAFLLNTFFKLIIVMSFPFILHFIGFYDSSELYRLMGAWKKWRNPLNWKKNILKIKL